MNKPVILNFGSLNIDYTYKMENIVRAEETLTAQGLYVNCGGKGLNQSIAAAKYGARVFHAGKVGADGEMLINKLTENRADASLVFRSEGQSGHAVIQVDSHGQNCIIVYPGANGEIRKDEIDNALSGFDRGTYLMLQNEINNMPYLIEKAYQKGMKIVFNPSPVTKEMFDYPLEKVSLFVLNETEGEALSGETKPEKIINKLHSAYKNADILLTLGENGAIFSNGESFIKQEIFETKVADTTAAGDTTTGYFVAALADGASPEKALKIACAAAAITVSRNGASDSIPAIDEVVALLNK